MGATSIDHVMRWKATPKEIEKAFKERRAEDAKCNGRMEGYSGDFQTVSKVDLRYLYKEFNSYGEAQDFCLDKAEKWETVVAVYFKENDLELTLIAGWGAE